MSFEDSTFRDLKYKPEKLNSISGSNYFLSIIESKQSYWKLMWHLILL